MPAKTVTITALRMITVTAPITTMTDGAASPMALFVWLSPTFPVGAFAYSHGLEWAVEAGDIGSAADLASWLDDLMTHGALRADAVLLAATWRAAGLDAVLAINELALALSPSSERLLETGAQGTAFLRAVAGAWPADQITRFIAARGQSAFGMSETAYPVAVGLAAAAHGIALRATLETFGLAAIGNLVSAVLRLGPIGQSDAQAIIARLTPKAAALAAWAETAGVDDLGTAAFRSDIAAMRHETQYSRLFRS